MNPKNKKNSYLIYKHTLLVCLSVYPLYQIKVKTGEPIGPIFVWDLPPSNYFAENPQKFPGIFHRKIQWKCRQLFRGISRNPFWGTRCEEFPVTWNSHNCIKEISCNQFQGISWYQFYRKNGENVVKIYENSWEFPAKSSSEPIPGELFPRFSQEFLRSILKYSQHIPE